MQLPDQQPGAHGKILNHGDGLGEADGDLVETRARELASIAGLSPHEVTDAHRYEARQELSGAVDPNVPNDASGPMADLIDEDDVIGESGGAGSPATNAATHGDEESIGEALYSEGISEAAHDSMTESRKQERRDAR